MIRPVPGNPCPHCQQIVVTIFTHTGAHAKYRVIRHSRNANPAPIKGDCYEVIDVEADEVR